MIIVQSVLLFLFYLSLPAGLTDKGSLISPYLLIIASLFGITIPLFFPLDEGGEIITWRGKMHLIIVIVVGILTIAGMIALWLRLQNVAGWKVFSWFSFISAIVALVLFIISGVFIESKYRRLLERLGATLFQVFYFVLPLIVFLTISK